MEAPMNPTPFTTSSGLALFRPPYEELTPISVCALDDLDDVGSWKGCAILWLLGAQPDRADCFEALRCKPLGLPLVVLLPPPTEIADAVNVLPLLRHLGPRIILPRALIDMPYRLRQILSAPPRSLPVALTDYLVRRGLLRSRRVVREFLRIVELAPETRSISSLSKRMYTSRRTLGRHFLGTGMPVPSHCLHFARLLHVAIQLQSDDAAVFRVASRLGYSDGFTMSNQMKRLTGYRPSQVRELLGWEWLVEAWLAKEGL